MNDIINKKKVCILNILVSQKSLSVYITYLDIIFLKYSYVISIKMSEKTKLNQANKKKKN